MTRVLPKSEDHRDQRRLEGLEAGLLLSALLSRVLGEGQQGLRLFVESLLQLSHDGLLLHLGIVVPVQARRGYPVFQG